MPVNKDYSVTFPLKASGRIDGKDIIVSLKTYLQDKDIKAVQITRTDCVITLTS